MNRKILRNKKAQNGLLTLFLSFAILSSSIFIATNTTINDSIMGITGNVISENTNKITIEKISEIEIWANTNIDFVIIENETKIQLSLDNGFPIENQSIEFYQNNSLIKKETTDSNGYVNALFNPFEISPGTLSEIVFQGSSTLYLNPSSKIIGEKPILENIINVTLSLNETNQTVEIPTNVSFNGLTCKKFEEQVFWSSGYSSSQKGSTEYYSWKVNNNCSSINKTNCILVNPEIKTRFLYIPSTDLIDAEEGFVKISNTEEAFCDNPENRNYNQYLAKEVLKEENKKFERHCSENKDAKCEEEVVNTYNETSCYGIEIHAPTDSITDVLEIEYSLCWQEGGENEN